MKIPNKFNLDDSSLKNDGFKKQLCTLINELIDCITILKKENDKLKNK